MKKIYDREIYLLRMSKPLQEKLKVTEFFPEKTKSVLDVGCADGTVTIAMAKLFPQVQFLGIDLDSDFIKIAQEKSLKLPNVSFEKIYLRELLARNQKFDVVTFISVLHEFYTYGEGISTVVKALADAHEILKKNGLVIIRDMIFHDYTKDSNLRCAKIVKKIRQNKEITSLISDFEKKFGILNNIYKINHFLLKYMYQENWMREGKEHYVPVTFEQYQQIFNLLSMKILYIESYLIEFLKNKWHKDFNFTKEELSQFKSTGIIAAQKI